MVDRGIEGPRPSYAIGGFATLREDVGTGVDTLLPGVGELVRQAFDGTLHEIDLQGMIVTMPAPLRTPDRTVVRINALNQRRTTARRDWEDPAIQSIIKV